jgi:hypothetical protein
MTDRSESDGIHQPRGLGPSDLHHIERMTSPTVTELPRRLEPVTRDSFLDEAETPAAIRRPREPQRSTMTTTTRKP